MKRYINKIHYLKSPNVQEKFIRRLLYILSSGYFLGINLRDFLYKVHILNTTRLPAYTISIGNLTTGGTGKTPITIEIARYVKEKLNKRVAVLSHGYGGQLSTKQINIVSNGDEILTSPHMAGDEPYLMAIKLKDIPVLTGKSRINTGKYAIENFGTEVLILDDGFQHIKLERDLNILIIDGNKKFGNNLLLPTGPLREPISEIKRADRIIVVNKKPHDKDAENSCEEFTEYLKAKFNKPVYLCTFKNDRIYNIKTLEQLTSSKKALAFTGIAQPEFFFNYLKEQNIELAQTKEFTDHHLYTGDDITNIIDEAVRFNADAIITTEKDAVKLLAIVNEINLEIPIFALQLKLDINLDEIIGNL